MRKATAAIKKNKTPEEDEIPGDLLKLAGSTFVKRLMPLFNLMWHIESISEDFAKALVIPLGKNKGDRDACGNYRGICRFYLCPRY